MTLCVAKEAPLIQVCFRNRQKQGGILGYEHGKGGAQTQPFGTLNWKGIIGEPHGMCNGHDQLFKHTLVIFKLSKAICHHIVQSQEINCQFSLYKLIVFMEFCFKLLCKQTRVIRIYCLFLMFPLSALYCTICAYLTKGGGGTQVQPNDQVIKKKG